MVIETPEGAINPEFQGQQLPEGRLGIFWWSHPSTLYSALNFLAIYR
jgi:hypothetical protein